MIQFKIEQGVAHITLNRPEKFNSFVKVMAMDLQERLDECATNDAIRAVYLTGTGRAFCAGQDLAEAIDPDNGLPIEKIVAEHYNAIILKIRNLAKPVVCAVNGVAAGAGANIALACDITVATEKASFIQAFSKIGLIPDSAGTFFLPRIVGIQRATAWMMLGDKISATEAAQTGMIYKVFNTEDFETESLKIAQKLATMPTKGLGFTKMALNASFNNSLEQQLQVECDLQYKAEKTEDYQEGVNAFLEKRKPVFKGK